ncbi:type II toxin-antitoxin system RelE/ParE family toxin [Natronomonas gomsonensis]|uniref:type II toxin-antitoxin system RelE family toxin n=1 Tax=Natronomonas gomsonensis TaxID=1046043 RepID=UPI0015B93D91|nr:type II toxin-antitoxin system RelE/ParE family toxin [Natronomonas gomsonensis]
MSEGWTWAFTERAAGQFENLDEVVGSEWREPAAFLEPLTGGPFSKLRIGQYRLACTLDNEEAVFESYRTPKRGYTADDD